MERAPLISRTTFWALVLSTFLLASCTRPLIKTQDQAMRPATRSLPSLTDDLDHASLVSALEADLATLNTKPSGSLRFGPREIAREDYALVLAECIRVAKLDAAAFRELIKQDFVPYEVYGRADWGEIFMTSYYEPVIDGSLTRTDRFTQPLYSRPRDMLDVDFASFGLGAGRRRARVLENRVIVAYPPRAEIDVDGAMKDRADILAWVDPIDGFMLEVQGSGVVRFADGSQTNFGYAAQNGHPYVSIGKFMFDAIPREKMSLQTIEAHLRAVGPAEARKLMNLNPSRVFFQRLPRAGLTSFGNEVMPGRTVATDTAYFPKGALAYLEFDRPMFASPEATEPTSWERTSRFVLDQDTGGAIKGADRLDLFWGRGPLARQTAGVMKHKAKLWYFVPKEELLTRLRAARDQR